MIKMKLRPLCFFILAIGLVMSMPSAHSTVSIIDFNIQKNEPDTNSAQVILYIHAIDGNKMNFSCDNSTYSAWVDYAETYSFNLNTGAGCTSGDGSKTVYIKVQDENADQDTNSDSINLDTTAPDINSVWHDANASDGNSFLNQYHSLIIRVTGEKDCNAFATIDSIQDLNLFDDGLHNDSDANDGVYGASFDVNDFGKSTSCMVYVVGKLVDRVGNTATKNSFTQLCIDLNNPTYSNENPKNYTNTRTPDINVKLLDSHSGVNKNSIRLWVNDSLIPDSNITKTPITNGFLVSYTPSSALTGTTISVDVYFDDNASNHLDVNWSFIIDENAPNAISDLNVKTVSGDNDLNLSWSTPTDIGGSGVSHYILYRYTQSITSANLSSATIVASNIDSTKISYIDAMGVANEDITYYYAIRAVDTAGNISSLSNSPHLTVPDLNAPTDINFSMPWYTNSIHPEITVTGTDVYSAKLSCDDGNYSSTFSSFPITTFSLISGNGCTNTDGNKTIYAIVYDNHDNNAKAQRSIYLDRNSPSTPTITDTNYSNGNNTVRWSASTDAGSGLLYYKVYYDTESGVSTSNSYVIEYDLNYTHSVTGRIKYCYRVQAVDLAGNTSELSEELCQLGDVNAPTIAIFFDGGVYRTGQKYFSSGDINVTVKADYSLKSVSGWVEYTDGNYSFFELSGSGNTFSGVFSLKAIDGNARIHVDAVDLLDLNASSERSFYIDSTPPEIKSLELKQESEELLEIKVSVSEDANRIEIEHCPGGECSPIAEILAKDLNNGIATIDWNIALLGIKEANIRAKVFDDLNNKAEESTIIILLLGIEEKMGTIDSIQNSLKSSLNLLGDYLLEPGKEVIEKFNEAKEHLNKARNAVKENNVEAVGREISQATQLLSEIESKRPNISVANTQVIDYSKEKDLLGESLSHHLAGSALIESKNLWNKLLFKREIQSIEVKTGNKVEKQLLVVLFVKNNGSTKITSFNVVERVPKAVSGKASLLTSNTLLEIVSEDPVISFFIPELQAGEEKIIKYKPKKAFTEEEIIAIESQALSIFDIPVPLPASYSVGEISFGEVRQGIPLPLILLIVVAGIAAYLYWRLRRVIA